jgi:hypothetical protein
MNTRAATTTAITATAPKTPPTIAPVWCLEVDPEKGKPEDDAWATMVDEGEKDEDEGGCAVRQEASLLVDTRNGGEMVESSPMVLLMTYEPGGTLTLDQLYRPDAGSRLESITMFRLEPSAFWRRWKPKCTGEGAGDDDGKGDDDCEGGDCGTLMFVTFNDSLWSDGPE